MPLSNHHQPVQPSPVMPYGIRATAREWSSASVVISRRKLFTGDRSAHDRRTSLSEQQRRVFPCVRQSMAEGFDLIRSSTCSKINLITYFSPTSLRHHAPKALNCHLLIIPRFTSCDQHEQAQVLRGVFENFCLHHDRGVLDVDRF